MKWQGALYNRTDEWETDMDTSSRRLAIAAFFSIAIPDPETGGTKINPEWQRVSAVGSKVRIAVADGSTKGLKDDPTFPPFDPLTDAKNQFDVCRSQGQAVLGYVSTRNARRSRAEVHADIELWYQSFTDDRGVHISGIFLDEGPELDVRWDSGPKSGQLITNAEFQDFYKQLVHDYKALHATENTVLINAAGFSKEWIMQPVDSEGNVIDFVMLRESSMDTYINNYKAIDDGGLLIDPPAWWTDPQYTDRVSHTIYLCPANELQNVLSLSGSRGAGNVYILEADPRQKGYKSLPPYWDKEVELI
jgi:hypothetical protein